MGNALVKDDVAAHEQAGKPEHRIALATEQRMVNRFAAALPAQTLGTNANVIDLDFRRDDRIMLVPSDRVPSAVLGEHHGHPSVKHLLRRFCLTYSKPVSEI